MYYEFETRGVFSGYTASHFGPSSGDHMKVGDSGWLGWWSDVDVKWLNSFVYWILCSIYIWLYMDIASDRLDTWFAWPFGRVTVCLCQAGGGTCMLFSCNQRLVISQVLCCGFNFFSWFCYCLTLFMFIPIYLQSHDLNGNSDGKTLLMAMGDPKKHEAIGWGFPFSWKILSEAWDDLGVPPLRKPPGYPRS